MNSQSFVYDLTFSGAFIFCRWLHLLRTTKHPKMKLLSTVQGVIVTVVVAILFSSCGGEQEKKVYDYEKADSLSVDYERELRSIRKDIKDAGNLYMILREIEVPYNNSLVQSPSNYASASGRKKQALSLGAAGADLNYTTMFEQNNESPAYVKAIMELASSLGIQSAFDQELMNTIIDNSDTTLSYRDKSNILTKAYRKAEDNLYSEERAQLTSLIVAGGWLESMYIASSIGASIESQREVDAEIWNMIFGAEKVVRMLEVFENDADCAAVAEDVKSLEPILKKLKEMQIQEVHSHFSELSEATGSLRSKWL